MYLLLKRFTVVVKALFRGKLSFLDESKLKFTEVKEVQLQDKIKHSYHYMDGKSELIFRYDNAKHYPALSTFPHHKHTALEVVESSEQNLEQILSEIEFYINNKREAT